MFFYEGYEDVYVHRMCMCMKGYVNVLHVRSMHALKVCLLSNVVPIALWMVGDMLHDPCIYTARRQRRQSSTRQCRLSPSSARVLVALLVSMNGSACLLNSEERGGGHQRSASDELGPIIIWHKARTGPEFTIDITPRASKEPIVSMFKD